LALFKKLSGFKDRLKDIKGQKHVFLFYKQEIVPMSVGQKRISFNELGLREFVDRLERKSSAF